MNLSLSFSALIKTTKEKRQLNFPTSQCIYNRADILQRLSPSSSIQHPKNLTAVLWPALSMTMSETSRDFCDLPPDHVEGWFHVLQDKWYLEVEQLQWLYARSENGKDKTQAYVPKISLKPYDPTDQKIYFSFLAAGMNNWF